MKKNIKDCSKVTMKLVQIYFKKLNKVAVISNFLSFFQFLVDKFTLLDSDPELHIECGSGSRRENYSGSGSTALHFNYIKFDRMEKCILEIYVILKSKISVHVTSFCPPLVYFFFNV